MMQPVALFGPLAVVVGAVIGSFANVVALRWSSGKGLQFKSRSRCSHCKRILRWFELIPVLSYIIQAGRCRDCGQVLSIRYLLVEILFACFFSSLVWVSGSWAEFLFLASAGTLLGIALLVDLEQLLLPDVLTVGFIVLVTVALLLGREPNLSGVVSSGAFSTWWSGVLIGGGGLGLLYLSTRGRGMGLGDVKLAAALGLSLGGGGMLLALGIAFVTGAIVGLGLLVGRRATLKSALPFGPFLILGWWVVLLSGHSIWAWYTNL